MYKRTMPEYSILPNKRIKLDINNSQNTIDTTPVEDGKFDVQLKNKSSDDVDRSIEIIKKIFGNNCDDDMS